MGDVSASGRTVLFVSHNIGSLIAVCQTGLLLEAGKLSSRDEISSVAKAYHRTDTTNSKLTPQAFHGPLRDHLDFDTIELNGRPSATQAFAMPNEALVFRIFGICTTSVPNFRFGFALSLDGVRLLTVHDGPEPLEEGSFIVTVKLPSLLLRPGDYMISLGGYRVDGDDWVWASDVAVVTITEEWGKNYDRRDTGVINLPNSIFREANSRIQGRLETVELSRYA
jgi:lipopolysaccharide transport system ATP-binding protein